MPADRYYLTAAQAADALGITLPTLYAYISRGQLHSEPVPGRSRQRRYSRDDVERLREKKESRRDPAKAVARGLHWGGPVLESGITLIHNGELYYRGQNAVALARTATLEQVAALLWGAEENALDPLFAQSSALPVRQLAVLRACARDPMTLMQAALPIVARADVESLELRPRAVRQTGARILRLLTTLIAGRESPLAIHQTLQMAWGRQKTGSKHARSEADPERAADAIRTALVLCADHELNVSAFAARCAASAGASPYDVVSAAMATLKGYKHGGAADRVLALIAESETPQRARAAVADKLRRGEPIQGLGHRLYPGGDPRAEPLLHLAEESGNAAAWRPFRNLARAAAALLQEAPNLDFGLAAVTRAYGLPEQAPLLLFAVGRTAGWMAHAIEEYESDQLIRPRARYTGPPPQA